MQCMAASGRRVRSLLSALIVLSVLTLASGCHPLRPVSRGLDSPDVVARTTQLRSVTDPTGRWRSQVTAEETPKVHVLPGHARVELLPDARLATNCFVYEQPILAGEATAQLLRAIAPGLRFKEFSALDIGTINQTPLVAFSLRFESTLGEKEQGEIDIFVLPRLDHPAMCSIETVLAEEQSPSARQRDDASRRVKEFLTNLIVTRTVNIALDEMWLLKQQDRTVGFRHVRIEKVDGSYATVTRSSHFSLTPDAIVNSDRIEQELEDEKGLMRMTWLSLADGHPDLRGQMERQDDGYRFGAESHGVVSNGRFAMSTPLLGSVGLHNALTKGGEGGSLDYYLPDVRVDGPALCTFTSLTTPAQQRCMSCAHPSGEPASVSLAGLHQKLPKTVAFHGDPSGVRRGVLANVSCSAETPAASLPEQMLLVATEGQWPSF